MSSIIVETTDHSVVIGTCDCADDHHTKPEFEFKAKPPRMESTVNIPPHGTILLGTYPVSVDHDGDGTITLSTP